MKKIVALFTMIFISTSSFAQESEFQKETMRDITTVAGLGLGGAVLGLSTLSFVEEPEDHLKNILVGGAIGMVIGVGVVAYNQANKTKQTIGAYADVDARFNTKSRLQWHASNTATDIKKVQSQNPNLNFNFTF